MDGTAAGASQLQDSVEPRFLAAACPRHRHCLQVLIHLLITEPVLRTPDPTRPFAIMTDASQYAMGCVLMQQASEDPSSLWHPVGGGVPSSKYAPRAGDAARLFAAQSRLPRDRASRVVDSTQSALKARLPVDGQFAHLLKNQHGTCASTLTSISTCRHRPHHLPSCRSSCATRASLEAWCSCPS